LTLPLGQGLPWWRIHSQEEEKMRSYQAWAAGLLLAPLLACAAPGTM